MRCRQARDWRSPCCALLASPRSASRPTRRSTRSPCSAFRERCPCRRSSRSVTSMTATGARSASSAATRSAACSRAPASTIPRRCSSCAPIRRARALPAAPGRRAARSRPTTTVACRACASSPSNGDMLSIGRSASGFVAQRETARRGHAPHASRRRNRIVAVRGRRRCRVARRGHTRARRRVRRRHRLLSRPAPRRPFHRAVRDALRRRRGRRHRTHRRGRVRESRHRATTRSCGARPTASEGYYDETGRSSRKAFLRSPMEFSRITSGFTQARLHPVLQTMARAQGHRFRRTRGHAGARDRRRRRHVRRRAERLRQRRHPAARQHVFDRIRASVALRAGGTKRARACARATRSATSARPGGRRGRTCTTSCASTASRAIALTVALPLATRRSPTTNARRSAAQIEPLAGELAVVRALPDTRVVAAN